MRRNLCALFATLLSVTRPEANSSSPTKITFTEHVAPILFRNCTTCHRLGQPAPFVLKSYEDAVSHADKIASSVVSRRMPPWQADPVCGSFANARLLTTNEIQVIAQWVATGKEQGDPKDLPPPPVFNDGWQLGTPDLIVRTPVPYKLVPAKDDTYYNLVLPVQLDRPRYVRAVEFSPGSAGVIHHAFIRLDRSKNCRKLAAENRNIGFPGVHLPEGAFTSDSQFLSWQPGRRPSEVPAGMSWQLLPGTDLVLQLHMPPTSVPIDVAPSVGLYFTEEPPARHGYKVRLTSFTFEIPPHTTNYVVREEFTTPIATTIVALLPHAHHLAQQIRVIASFPGVPPRTILDIPHWDFDWQTDYNLQPELPIPAGTKLSMEISYSNPTSLPVKYGPNSTDEMAELWILLAIKSPAEYNALAKAEAPLVIRDSIAYNQYLLRQNPRDWHAHLKIANALLVRDDAQLALAELQKAEAIAPTASEPHYWAGFALRQLKRTDEAARKFQEAIQCDPRNWQAHGTLGLMALEKREYKEAASHFRNALAANPNDRTARKGLAEAEARSR